VCFISKRIEGEVLAKYFLVVEIFADCSGYSLPVQCLCEYVCVLSG